MSGVRADEIDRVSLVLDVEGERVLALDLAADGGVRRSGTGQPGTALEAYQGVIDPSVFRDVIAGITDELLAREGRYSDPQPQGTLASLTAVFAGGGERTGLEFRYGAQSQGPPPPLTALVRDAVELTDDWYHEQVAAAAS
jgi:hypothetical protein